MHGGNTRPPQEQFCNTFCAFSRWAGAVSSQARRVPASAFAAASSAAAAEKVAAACPWAAARRQLWEPLEAIDEREVQQGVPATGAQLLEVRHL